MALPPGTYTIPAGSTINIPGPAPAPTPGGGLPMLPASAIPPGLATLKNETFPGTTLPAYMAPYWYADGNTQNATVMKAKNVTVSNGLYLLLSSDRTGALVNTSPWANPPDGKGFSYQATADKPVVVEIVANLPGSGTQVFNWPALWATGEQWPGSEQDFVEGLQGSAQAHLHTVSGSPGLMLPDAGPGLHTYTYIITPAGMTAYVDGLYQGVLESPQLAQPNGLIFENSLAYQGAGPASLRATIFIPRFTVWQ